MLLERPTLHYPAKHLVSNVATHPILSIHFSAYTPLLSAILQSDIYSPDISELCARWIEEIIGDFRFDIRNLL